MAKPTSAETTAMLTEHFGYPPVSLLDDIINSINNLAGRALDSIEQGLLQQPPSMLGFRPDQSKALSAEEAHRLEVQNGTHQLETLLYHSIDRNFDLFELYVMRNIFLVKPEDRGYMRLSHYDGLDLSDSSSNKPTTEFVAELRRRLHASQQLHTMLHAERARNDALLQDLRALVGTATPSRPCPPTPSPLSFLQIPSQTLGGSSHCTDGDGPLATTTAFSLSQLQSLRDLSAALRTLAPHLAENLDPEELEVDDHNEKDRARRPRSWRRARTEYVEKAVRRHVENARGLELGAEGAVRDGEWQGGGGPLGKAEVEALERVVSLLGKVEDGECEGDSKDERFATSKTVDAQE